MKLLSCALILLLIPASANYLPAPCSHTLHTSVNQRQFTHPLALRVATLANDINAALHSDAYIRNLAQYNIDDSSINSDGLLCIKSLDCSYAKSTQKERPFLRRSVMQWLGLQETLMQEFCWKPVDKIVLLRWKVSPSYELVVMTGSRDIGAPDEWRNDAITKRLSNPSREIYGIRFVKIGKLRWDSIP